ncbi:MAG: YqgE/AlgH family protein [Alphaproteobacteria bacterium]
MPDNTENKDQTEYLTGQLLVAMPHMEDQRFARSVVYICAHTDDGAMGLILNKLAEAINFSDLLEQLNLPVATVSDKTRVHFGGPVETGRGFVLHSDDFTQEASLLIENGVALTATVDILSAISEGNGPRNYLLALGYEGWAPGQLDSEIQANGWLIAPADTDILFGSKIENKWNTALSTLGIDVTMLSSHSGHA